MLLCGIIDELSSAPGTANVSFFFCQAPANKHCHCCSAWLNLLAGEQAAISTLPCPSWKALFQDTNALHTLSRIFMDILKYPAIQKTYYRRPRRMHRRPPIPLGSDCPRVICLSADTMDRLESQLRIMLTRGD
ncbi:hypothetical protein N7507_004729 [Penicillium longicatenatum]|nr:hypothetical protein N7507_004729 [Penicillium longicatenatum]